MKASTLVLLFAVLALLAPSAHGLKTCIYCNRQDRLSCHLGKEGTDDYQVLYQTGSGARNRAYIFACSTYQGGAATFICNDVISKGGRAFAFKRSTSGKPAIDVKSDCP